MTAPSAWTIQAVMAIANAVLLRMAQDGTLDTDEAALMDALRDGGADVDGLLVRLLRARGEALANEEAIKQRIDDLQTRKARFARQAEEYRAAANSILEVLGLTKWRSAEFTVSVAAGRPGVILTDETALPDRFVRIERKADKTAIKAALEAGEIVPGAELANGIPTMRVLSK